MNIAWRSAAALVATFGVAVGVAWTAHADDDDDDDYEPSHSSIESWPPTELSWPPLTPPEDGYDEAAPPVVPLP
ncbi:hypothetical protein [Mycolicibacterium stellerae]|uniref:hypothetical protein n=1 Tax=Mycolicibacterium stellerae TaxID=2358193 RepID=UPI000F0BBC82|nr:hypothetical protein [Mycolicibacterium stellerae]